MSKEILVVLPHDLSQDEARRRVADALERARISFPKGMISATVAWPSQDRADIGVAALGQNVSAQVVVEPEQVRVRVLLPWLLASLAGKITERIERVGGASLQIGHNRKGPGGAA